MLANSDCGRGLDDQMLVSQDQVRQYFCIKILGMKEKVARHLARRQINSKAHRPVQFPENQTVESTKRDIYSRA
jgi:hypothetical protein